MTLPFARRRTFADPDIPRPTGRSATPLSLGS